MMSKDPGRLVRTCLLSVTAALLVAGCHHETEWEPLASQNVYVSDRFYDVAALSPKEALVIGYGGKLLHTADHGVSWKRIDVGSENSLYSIGFATDKIGWIVGQESDILRTEDGGQTWKQQGGDIWMRDDCRETAGQDSEECGLAPLFALSVVDENTAMAVGDRSTFIKTTDGGRTWQAQTLAPVGLDELDLNSLLAFEDPVLYDLHFFDAKTGIVVGEFGKIFLTQDGGATWHEKQASLVGPLYFDVMDLPTFFDIEFADRMNGLAVGLEGRVARTADGGETWAWEDHGVDSYSAPFHSAAILPDGTAWVVGASGQVVKRPANGNFARGSFGTAVSNWIRKVEFYDQSHGWVVGGFGFIMSTSDGGETWFRRIG